MNPSSGWERRKALIVVRTYPTPAKKGVEVSCTAAITPEGEWLRLFPVPYRLLDRDKRFRKYQWIAFDAKKAKDNRPESYKIRPHTIEVLSEPLSTAADWRARREAIAPLVRHCMCCIKRTQEKDGSPTLGVFRPALIERLAIEQCDSTWKPSQLAALRQGHLFEKLPETELEKVPFNFRYHFRCPHDTCTGHTMICTDWEIGQSWRSWRDKYGPGWEAKLRERYEQDMMRKKDTHFFVGTVRLHPNAWIIVGLFYPPKPAVLPLFES